MTFLEPALLFIIAPFVALPIIIHFINRMRYTPLDWAAMDFLFRAKRSSTKFAKLREILILACRCLAILCLGLALARPLSGGWLGGAFGGASDTVIILLDRSSSMAVLDKSGQKNKLERAIAMVKDAANNKEPGTKFVLVDSATARITELTSLEILDDPDFFSPVDSSADIFGLLENTYEYINARNPGNCEIWITGDLQWSNWRPDRAEWEVINADFKNLNAKVEFRLLALSHLPEKNIGIRVKEVNRYVSNNKNFIDIVVILQRNYTDTESVRVNMQLNEVETVHEVEMTQESLEYVHTVEISIDETGGYGRVSLPKDHQPGDNSYYFAYGSSMELKTAVLSKGRYSKLLVLAAAPVKGQNKTSVVIDDNQLPAILAADYSLVIVENIDLSSKAEKELLSFAERGGRVLLFAPLQAGDKVLKYIQGGEVESAQEEEYFPVAKWDDFDGPLAKSRQGESLPLDGLYITFRQLPSAGGQVMAIYEDGQPFLSRYGHGKGAIYYCSSSIEKKWSDLYKGAILLPMLNRMIAEGAEQYSEVINQNCRFDESLEGIESVSGDSRSVYSSLSAGVFKMNDKILVLNRPDEEDESLLLAQEELQVIFRGLDFSMFNETDGSSRETVQSELFPVFVVLILLFLAVEGFLTLRKSSVEVMGQS